MDVGVYGLLTYTFTQSMSAVEAARKSNISAVSCKIVKYIFLSR